MKILIIDDHSLFREGLSHVLNALDEQISILEASNYEHALQHVSQNRDLDLVLLDLNMPGKDGFSVLTAMSENFPAVPVVILSGSTQPSDVKRALDSGAVGYIPKDSTSSVMLNALKLILAGGIYVPPGLMQPEPENINGIEYSVFGLTQRQCQVLALLIEGHSNKKIASLLQLAEPTVKMHVTAILKAMGVTNRTQAAREVEKLGLKLS